MDNAVVHRCRFVEWMPSGITCICADPSQTMICVGRECGDIEVWSIRDYRRFLRRFPAQSREPVGCMAWISSHGRDLIMTSSMESSFSVWSLNHPLPVDEIESNAGAVFCMSVCGQYFAVGCESSVVKLYRITGSSFENRKTFSSHDGKVLSVGFGKKARVLVCGTSNGCAMGWMVDTSTMLFRVNLNVGDVCPLVWCISVLPDMVVVTGDSTGRTMFWDASLGVLVQSFQSHDAPILAVDKSESGKMVYSSGVDNSITEFQLVEQQSATAIGSGKWISTSRMHPHTHDIRALVMCSSEHHKLLVSGGMDCRIGLTPVESCSRKLNSEMLLPFPSDDIVSFSQNCDRLLVQHDLYLDLWHIDGKDEEHDSPSIPNHIFRLHSSSSCIMCSCISPNGKFVSFSTLDDIALFCFDEISGVLDKVSLSTRTANVTSMIFTNDSKHLVLATLDNGICMLTVAGSSTGQRDGQTVSERKESFCSKLAISADGQWLAAMSSDGRDIDIINVDTLTTTSRISGEDGGFCALEFHPTQAEILVAVTLNNIVTVYDIDKCCRRKSLSGGGGIGRMCIACTSDQLRGISFCPTSPDLMLIYSLDSIEMVSVKSVQGRVSDGSLIEGRKCAVIRQYQSLLFASFLGSGHVLVVERPWTAIMAALPDIVYRKTYRT